MCLFLIFQAEDGIRDIGVTGVQTCALPIWTFWSLVYAWMVVIRPRSMPNVSSMTLAIGARQFVVHEALEMMLWLAGSEFSWLTPMTMVMSSPLAGAEMTTFLAPAVMCLPALAASVKKPVDSMRSEER